VAEACRLLSPSRSCDPLTHAEQQQPLGLFELTREALRVGAPGSVNVRAFAFFVAPQEDFVTATAPGGEVDVAQVKAETSASRMPSAKPRKTPASRRALGRRRVVAEPHPRRGAVSQRAPSWAPTPSGTG
jgi:hypothetical protein